MGRPLRIDELATADRRKDEFLATVCHELRSPLAAIQNASRLLSSENAERLARGRERRSSWSVRSIFSNQADTGDPRSRSGLGIGLALVRNIVALHGGSVTAASDAWHDSPARRATRDFTHPQRDRPEALPLARDDRIPS